MAVRAVYAGGWFRYLLATQGGPQRVTPEQLIERRYCRYKVNRPVKAVVTTPKGKSQEIVGRCEVLSEGGFGAMLGDRLNIGEIVLVQFEDDLKLYAVVRNVAGLRHGLEFVVAKQAMREAVGDLCDHFGIPMKHWDD
jgi:hypothetical protein